GDGQAGDVGLSAGAAGEHDLADGRAAPLAVQDDGTGGEDVGQRDRLDVVGVEALEAHLDAGEHGRVDVVGEARGGGGRVAVAGDDERLALAGAGEAFDELAVDAGADAEGEDVAATKIVADAGVGLGLDRNVAVG